MKQATPQTIYLKDYRQPSFLIPEVHLRFDLREDKATITSVMKIKRNPEVGSKGDKDLVLHGQEVELLSLKIDGKPVPHFSKTDYSLKIPSPPEQFTLEVTNEVDPINNTSLEGLYKSGDIFCTQNEPEGFRKITYFLDRSDVMSKYTTTIEADKQKYPILLSNGNKVGQGDLDNGRHWVKWVDPYKKPSYLFALVAGDLGVVQDEYITSSGRKVNLEIFVDKGNEEKSHFAMESLKQSMKWDEDTYGLEYDLDIYMIVAVEAFNMAAMENKGLNIFNSRCVLADTSSATDDNFMMIQAVIGHEYFHNWTGNRVTCRDWFQLTLKEGLTVYRDQEFSSDLNSRSVKRIEDVRELRRSQFEEDSGPNAHPIRPNSFIEINNFYTSTVYEKGAEVIRMVATLVGKAGFRKGLDKYFELFDGQAVTTDDFIHAMETANDLDLTQFKNWYDQAGTPELIIKDSFDEKQNTYTLIIEQRGGAKPFYMPFKIGLIDQNGESIKLSLEHGNHRMENESAILIVDRPVQEFKFENVDSPPIPSLNREFSAPVKVSMDYDIDQMLFLMVQDKDTFNRWEMAQELSFYTIKSAVNELKNGNTPKVLPEILRGFKSVLLNNKLDPHFRALIFSLPSESVLSQQFSPPDFDLIHQARNEMAKSLAFFLEDELLLLYKNLNESTGDELTGENIGKRALKNNILAYLPSFGPKYLGIIKDQYFNAKNMTDQWNALQTICHYSLEERQEVVRHFYEKWKTDPLVLTKWFSAQALSSAEGTLDQVKELISSSDFNIKLPNHVRAVVSTFANHNPFHFNKISGEGYSFLADFIKKVDPLNPSLASDLAISFCRFQKLDDQRKKLMEKVLRGILECSEISKNTYEIVSKTL